MSYAPLGTCGKRNVYAQRVDVYGNTVWAENGIAICSEAEDQIGPQVTFDGSGGAVIVWMDYRDGDCDVYAQRIDAYGTIQMYNNGEPVCLRAGDQEYLKVTTDHGADLMFVWVDEDSDIFAQKLIGDFSTPPVSCDVTWEIVDANTGLPTGGDRLSGCPAGDWLALKVHLDFSGGPIDASSISVAYDLPLIFWDENTADGPATFENGFHTTLTRKYISVDGYKTGECPLFDISILLDGVEIGRIEDLSIKSADYTGDGFVNLKDWRAFERTYNYCAGNGKYNDWFDFNCDGCVDLSDYSYISEHYMHKVPGNLDGMLAENVRDLDKEAPTIEGVQGDAENPVYRDFLEGNHPNPFNPSTTIRYSIAEDAHVNLSIYGADGRLVRTLVDRVKERGKHSATWDGMNEQGVAVASGIYFYRMRTGSYAESKKLILLR